MKCPKCNFENPEDTKFCGECGTQLSAGEKISAPVTETLETPKEELTTGSTFAGRYQIIEELGKGGMGKVYKAQDTDLKEKVAIKLLKPEIAADKKTIERFRNELKFARKIRHKNVCQMYDLNKEEGTHYITMEYVDGKDLKSMIRMMGQLSAGKTIYIAKQVCEGLTEAHRLGVVHRDLKPQNIMVDEDGNARIMDFGIARSLKTKGITATGVMIGTPEYMSPEQVEGKEVDQRSDIYSLGVILYEMVTGKVPFEGDTPFTIGVKHKSETPKDPKELNTQLPEELNRVILRCLEKDREKRYQSAGEVRAELVRIEKGIPTTEIEIPKKKPLTSREITVTFGLKKLFIPAIVVAVLIIAAIVIWQLLPKKEAIPVVPSDKPSLAVMYFENNTGDENLDIWRSALSDLLISDLSQSKYIRVLPRDRLFGILKQLNLLEAKRYSSEDLKEVASRGGASHILQGILTRAGENFRINTTVQESGTMEIIGSDMVEGKGEESFHTMVDDLTRRIKANFKLTSEEIASDIDREVGEITTSSPEAYRYYSEARKYHLGLDYREAIKLYEKAVAIDPEFAMAYRAMAAAYSNLGYQLKEKENIQKAMDLSDRVSERERYQIQGNFYYQSEKTYDKAIEAFEKLLELYPDDGWANSYLGLIYSDLEEFDKAIKRFEVAAQIQKDILNCGNLAGGYEVMGLYDNAKKVYENYIENVKDSAQAHGGLAYTYIFQGKYELALEEADKAFLLDPSHQRNFYLKGDIYYLRGDFLGAEKEYLKILETGDKSTHTGPRIRLAAIYISQGRFEKAKDQLKQAISLAEELGAALGKSNFQSFMSYVYLKTGNPEKALELIEGPLKVYRELESLWNLRFFLTWKGIAYLEVGSIDEAQKVAVELKDLIQEGMNKKAMRYYNLLEGMIELKRENFSKAIENCKKAIALLPYQSLTWDEHAFFIDPLALAYYKAGELEKARAEYERITKLTTGRTGYGDIYARSFYMLGKIHEQQGQKDKATEYYEKFLGLWKDADPGIHEVDDAGKRLAALKLT
jgi:serine/threonine protein kinase/Tfp pilus assembly protein PilF